MNTDLVADARHLASSAPKAMQTGFATRSGARCSYMGAPSFGVGALDAKTEREEMWETAGEAAVHGS